MLGSLRGRGKPLMGTLKYVLGLVPWFFLAVLAPPSLAETDQSLYIQEKKKCRIIGARNHVNEVMWSGVCNNGFASGDGSAEFFDATGKIESLKIFGEGRGFTLLDGRVFASPPKAFDMFKLSESCDNIRISGFPKKEIDVNISIHYILIALDNYIDLKCGNYFPSNYNEMQFNAVIYNEPDRSARRLDGRVNASNRGVEINGFYDPGARRITKWRYSANNDKAYIDRYIENRNTKIARPAPVPEKASKAIVEEIAEINAPIPQRRGAKLPVSIQSQTEIIENENKKKRQDSRKMFAELSRDIGEFTYVGDDSLVKNPYAFEGETIVSVSIFDRMIDQSSAVFKVAGGNFFVENIDPKKFSEKEWHLMAVEISGKKKIVTSDESFSFLPFGSYVDHRKCENSCQYFLDWKEGN